LWLLRRLRHQLRGALFRFHGLQRRIT